MADVRHYYYCLFFWFFLACSPANALLRGQQISEFKKQNDHEDTNTNSNHGVDDPPQRRELLPSYSLAALGSPTIGAATASFTSASPPRIYSITASVEGDMATKISSLKARLLPYSFNRGVEFDIPGTYQSKALERMATILGMDGVSNAQLVQFYVLYCIFEATNGMPNTVIFYDQIPGWITSSGWDSEALDVTVLNPCQGWYGIACDADNKVTAIELSNNRLTGNFPPEIVWLASDGSYSTGAGNLNRLDVTRNEYLSTQYGDTFWWWQNLGSNFEYLLFQQTSWGGSLAKLPRNLIVFDCSYTLISGGLTNAVFTGLNRLKYVDVSGNFFNATVPKVLGILPELEYLYVSDAAIRGDLSYMKGGMYKIVEHWNDFNPLVTGSIPTVVGTLKTLQSLSLSQNGLIGTIPTELGLLPNLQRLWLAGNSLKGRIPSELGGLENLQVLHLEGNALRGSMPSEICANYDGGIAQPLTVVGTDCSSLSGATVNCPCCTCCSMEECEV